VKTNQQFKRIERVLNLYYQDNRGPQKIYKITGIPLEQVKDILRNAGVPCSEF